MLEAVTGLSREAILARPERTADAERAEKFKAMVTRRCSREPLAYTLGVREFYGREFDVDRSTLIPRAESEGLVDLALAAIDAQSGHRHVLDVGTGSGALAVTLLAERPDVEGVATDVDLPALVVARRNAQRHNVAHRLHFVASSLADALQTAFPLVIANLPYVPTARLAELAPEVARFEPRIALDGGPDGMNMISSLLRALPRILTADGFALFEIDESHGAELSARARAALPECSVRVVRDARGDDRYLVVERGAQ